MKSTMLSPRNGDPHGFTSLSVALSLYYDAYGSLINIFKVGEGSRTFDKRPERFSSATINIGSLESH